MGDVVMVTHAIRALRESYPDLRITILTRPFMRPIFDGLQVDFMDLDLDDRHNSITGIRRLAREISELGVDAVADMHNVIRTKILRLFLKPYRIPIVALLKGRFRTWMRMDGGCSDVTEAMRHTVVRYCDVIRRLGFAINNPKPATKTERPIPLPLEKGQQRWVGIAPFSAHEGKSYPPHLVERVIALLAQRYDRVFIHSGGGEEEQFALAQERLYDNVMALFPRVKLGGEIDLISNLDCIITMDSFAMHAASIVATPVVSVWGATHPSLGFSGYGCDTEGIVQLDMPCRPCSTYGDKKCRFRDYRCMTNIPPEMIIERVEYIISK